MPASSGVPGQSADSPPGAADGGVRWRRVFPGDQPQLAILRRWLYSFLPDCPARADIVSVATELGTNAVLHTATGSGGWFAVEITCYGPLIRVAVADCGGPVAEPHLVHEPAGEHGRGLALVRGLAARAGFVGDHHGRVVWADLPWEEPCAQRLAAPHEAAWRPAYGSYHAQRASLSA